MNILTSFPFTFKLTVPGLSNPFTSLATNPPSPTTSKNLPVQSKAPVREADARTRSLVRPTRPLPISISPRPSSRGARPAIPAFPPLANAATSTSLSRAHGQSHLAPLAQFQVQGPPAAPVNRKRGWEPSYSPSPSEATLASSNGYFETPARYRELGGQDSVEVQYVHGVRDLDDDDMPPAKRRRGLAGSIVSSAWSAALMGTAVGLTVYKLWRDRGKTDEDGTGYPSKMQHEIVVQDMDAMLDEPSSPPPPYNHEWGRQRDLANETSDSYLQPSLAYQQQILQQQHQVPKSRGKHRAATVTPKAQRKTAGQSTRRVAAAKSVGRSGAAVRSRLPIPSQFDFEHPPSASAPVPTKRPRSVYEPSYASSSTNRYPDVSSQDVSMEENEGPEGEDDDQMDWLGGKLAQLIEEGKKALGKEVVVCSDAKEDEVDDGSGAWVSDDEYNGIPGALGGERVKRRSSVKGRIGRSSTVSNGSAPYGSTATQVGLSAPTTPSRARFGVTSLPASPSSASLVKESEQFESPEVREMMEKARAKIAARLGKA